MKSEFILPLILLICIWGFGGIGVLVYSIKKRYESSWIPGVIIGIFMLFICAFIIQELVRYLII